MKHKKLSIDPKIKNLVIDIRKELKDVIKEEDSQDFKAYFCFEFDVKVISKDSLIDRINILLAKQSLPELDKEGASPGYELENTWVRLISVVQANIRPLNVVNFRLNLCDLRFHVQNPIKKARR